MAAPNLDSPGVEHADPGSVYLQVETRVMKRMIGLLVAMFVGCEPESDTDAGERGEPIPGTGIVSCGEAMATVAPPSGHFVADDLAGMAESVLEGSITWQASCPEKRVDYPVETEFELNRFRVLTDDAGSPDLLIDEGSTDFGAILTCKGIGGGQSEQTPIDGLMVQGIDGLCVEQANDPFAGPLHIHVELEGRGTTCSNDSFDLSFRSKVKVLCP
jgi:hypothetical protein